MNINLTEKLDSLINNPLNPNPSEWAMGAEDILEELNALTSEAKKHIDNVITHNGVFPQHNDALIALLKREKNKIGSNIVIPPIKSRRQVFVAMWFDNETERLYKNVLTPVVQKLNYSITKINEQEYEGSIISKIVDNIMDSNILIADLTGNRGGVYYEAGIARGLQLCNHPIKLILTCNKNFFNNERVHFDLQGDNIILYETDADYEQKLTKRITAIIEGSKE